MRKLPIVILAAITLAGGFVGGTWVGWHVSSQPQTASGRKVLYWIDPMHPSYKSDKPGVAPDCGMQLEPVYADETGQDLVPGAVRVSDDRRQLIGVRTGTVDEQPIERTVRTVGRVVVDDNRLYRLLAASDGLVRQIFDNSTGSLVRKNELLLTYFTRDYLTAQQAYFFGLDTLDRLTNTGAAEEQVKLSRAQVRSAIDGLLNLGMGEIQIAALAKTRRATTEIELRSPVTGYVMSRSVTPQQRFDRGAELYQIADLGHVWIMADVFENEARYLRAGTPVRVSQPYARSLAFDARVSTTLPRFDADSRTLKIRLEADNVDYSLRPGMFVDVALPVSLPRAVTVPVDAVVDTGTRKTVFVDRGASGFEAREVETGWRFDDRVEIVKGLAPGERIVVSGMFLLDSESRMKAAAAGIASPVRDPVCGMEIDKDQAAGKGNAVTYQGQEYYFCSETCRKRFQADPGKYARSVIPAQLPAVVRSSPLADLRPIDAPGLETVPGADATSPPPAVARRFEQLAAVRGLPDVPLPAPPSGMKDGGTKNAALKAQVDDPICGMAVDVEAATARGLKTEYRGTLYYFCSEKCKKTFDADPAKYAGKKQMSSQ